MTFLLKFSYFLRVVRATVPHHLLDNVAYPTSAYLNLHLWLTSGSMGAPPAPPDYLYACCEGEDPEFPSAVIGALLS